MRRLREIPRMERLACNQMDNGWCLTNRKWCYMMEGCKIKSNTIVPEPEVITYQPYTKEQLKELQAIANKSGKVIKDLRAFAKKHNRSVTAAKTKIQVLRKQSRRNNES